MIDKNQPLDNEISAAVIGGILSVLEDFKRSGRPIDHEDVMRGFTSAFVVFACRTEPRDAITALATMKDYLERIMADPAEDPQSP